MGKLQKLSQGHLDEIYRRSAMGHGPTRIAKALAAGLLNDAGTELSPVEITPPGVRYHLQTVDAQTAVRRWRTELYGDFYAQPLAHSGRRLEALSDALAGIEGERCKHCGRGGAPIDNVAALVRLIDSARKEEAQLLAGRVAPPSAPAAPQGGTMNRGLMVNVLAEGLAELAHVGRADAVLDAIKGTVALPTK